MMMEPVLISSQFGQSTTVPPSQPPGSAVVAGKIKARRATATLVVGSGGAGNLGIKSQISRSMKRDTTITAAVSVGMGQIVPASPTTKTVSVGLAATPTIVSTVAATTPAGTKQNPSSAGHQIPSDILDDLASRFIINVPDDERNNLIRICFQIELAHWFYLDFFCSIEEKKLVPCGIKQFATHLFHHIPFLRMHLSGIDKILEDWKEYKLSVPTYGAILMSEDLKYVLLVQSYWAKCSWGFPKGKVNEHEDPIHCATREVFEETGYDITGLIVPNDYIEGVINYQYTRLYLVRNVPIQTLFSPRTRKEIKCCEWFPVDSLPTNKNEITKANLGINAHSFFMIKPFIKRLKKWVQDNRSGKIDTGSAAGVAVGSPNAITAISLSNSFKMSSANLCSSNNNRKGDFKQNGNSGALIVNSSGYRVSFGCSNVKRQRHKSMGDIDGIKINVTSNYNGSVTKSFTGTKLSHQPPQTPNSISELSSVEYVSFKRDKYSKTNSKRQLFNSSSSSGNCSNGGPFTANYSCTNNNVGSSDILATCNIDKRAGNCCGRINRPTAVAADVTTAANKVNSKCKSKSVGNIQPEKGSSGTSSLRQSASSTATNLPLLSSHSLSSSSSSSSSSRMSPTLESWTSFTFTKNFIANVFC